MIVSDTSGGHTRARCRDGRRSSRAGGIGRDTALWHAGRRAVRPHGFGPARRVAAPLSWLAARTSRLSAAAQDVLLVEAEATRACMHGCRPIPSLVQAEGYFRAVAPKLLPGRGDGLLNRSPGESPSVGSVESRRFRPTVQTGPGRRLAPPDGVRYVSVDTATRGSIALRGDTP